MQAFVGGDHALEPAVGHFVHRDPHQAAHGALTGDEGDHGVFHAAVASLNHSVLGVGVRSDVFVDERHGSCGVVGKRRPVAVQFRGILVNQSQRHTVHIHRLFHEVRVGCPSKIDHVGRLVPVNRSWRAVGKAGRLGGLLDAGGAHNVALREVNAHVVVAPNAVKLSSDVGIGVPSVVVKLTQLGEPLGHAVFHAFLVHPSGAANLTRHLCGPGELKGHRLSSAERLGQHHFQDGAVFHEVDGLSVDLDPGHALPTPFVFRQGHNAASHASVGV